MSTVFSSNLEPSCGVVFSNIFSLNRSHLIRNMTTSLPPDSVVRGERCGGGRQARLSDPRARDRKGRRPSSEVPACLLCQPFTSDNYSPTDVNSSIDWRQDIKAGLQTRSLLTNDSFHKTMPPRTEPEDATFPRSKN